MNECYEVKDENQFCKDKVGEKIILKISSKEIDFFRYLSTAEKK